MDLQKSIRDRTENTPDGPVDTRSFLSGHLQYGNGQPPDIQFPAQRRIFHLAIV